MIIYFSATGNSRYCAQMIASELGDELLDAAGLIKTKAAAELCSERPWVFVAPTYAWQLPRIFADFIRQGSFSGSRQAWFVMTCGGHIGNAGARIAPLCREKGLDYMGVLQVVMPENYIALYNAPDEAESAAIIAAARPVLAEGVQCISRGDAFPAKKRNMLERLQTALVNPLFYSFCVKAGPFRASGACTGCGRCVKGCPLNNIRLAEGRPQWGRSCTHCMTCICGCPAQAIEYGRSSRGKPRYQCPDYEA